MNGKSRKYTPVLIGSLLATLFLFSACKDTSGPGAGPGEPENTPATAVITPVQGQVGEPYQGTLKVEDPDGLKSVEITGPDSTWTYEASGELFETQIDKEFESPEQRDLIIRVTDKLEDITTINRWINVLPEGNFPPSLQVSHESNKIDEVTFHITAEDNKLLDRIELDYGIGTKTIDVQKASVDTSFTRHFGTDGGIFAYIVEAIDSEGLSSTETGEVELTGWADIQINWKTYFYDNPVNGGELLLNHRSVDFDTLLVSSNGSLTGTVPKGVYEAFLVANPSINGSSELGDELSNISRINLTHDYTTRDYEEMFWHGRDDTYLISGPGVRANVIGEDPIIPRFWKLGTPKDVKFDFDLSSDLSTFVQTLENTYDATNEGSNGYLLEEMSRQTNFGMLEVPDAAQTLYIIHNWGDHNCPSNWTAAGGAQQCTEGIPPGIPIDTPFAGYTGEEVMEIAINDFSDYVERRMNLLEHEKVGGNPYNVEIISGWAEDIVNYVYKEGTVHSRKDNVEYFAHSIHNRERVIRNNTAPYTIKGSVAHIGIGSAGLFDNESTMAFSIRESSPIVWKSVRDEEQEAWDSGYSVVPETGFYPKDELFHKIANGFGPYAQQQYIEGQTTDTGTPYKGFNIQLYHYDD